MILPREAAVLLDAFAPLFTQPTVHRFVTLLAGVLLTPGRRTVANLLRTLDFLAPGHPVSHRRVLSAARWSGVELGCVLAGHLLKHFVPAGPVTWVGDDTVDGHPGRRVYGKARRRDPVRSSHSYTAWRHGHKWVVQAVLVRLPLTTRPCAPPVLVDSCRSAEDDRRRKRKHRTPAQLMRRLLRLVRLVLLRFPDRRFTFVGDAGYGTHEVARFCHRHRDRLALVSKWRPVANLFTPPPPYAGKGRPRVKGDRLPMPREAVAGTTRLTRLTVGWYGGGTRRVGTKAGAGHWYKAGQGLVPIRWVFVRDLTGAHRAEYFFTTDPAGTPAAVIEHYCGRWNIETTFQECRSCLGLESTRGWCRATARRAAPCLFGLYSVVAALYHALPDGKRVGRVAWPGKAGVTFSDAVTAVRRWLWADGAFLQACDDASVKKPPPPMRDFLLNRLAMAA